jgi:hypothetical protein
VDAWRTARRRASRGRDDGAAEGEAIAGRKVELDGSVATDFSVSEATVDGTESTTGRSRPVVRDDRPAQSTDADAGEDMTSRLLRAKRRAGTGGDDASGGGSNG